MRRIVSKNKNRNNRGVTLVEVMISLVIMLVVFMGLIQASLLSIDNNLRNEMRDEGVRLGSEYMTRSRQDAWATTIPSIPSSVTRTFRNFTQTYYLTRTLTTMPDNVNKQITIQVAYTYKSAVLIPGDPNTFSFRLNSIVRKPS